MKEAIFLNGEFVSEEEARVSLNTSGFLHGWGIFETMRAYKNKIIYLDAHLERLRRSLRLIGLRCPYATQKLKDAINHLIKINALRDAYLRLTLYQGERETGLLLIARKYKPYSRKEYNRGFSAGVAKFVQDENSLLARIKSISRLLYELSLQEAKEKGFAEAIILNSSGNITEGTRSNIFLVKNKVLFTPALECGCLAGITRSVILDLAKRHKVKSRPGNFSLQDLYNANEAFLTNSLWGVMPLRKLENIRIGKGQDKLTQFLGEEYNRMLYVNKQD